MDYDIEKYKVRTWKSLMMLHWILNPGAMFNELLFGQRIPKVMLVERDAKKNLAEKTFVPCPHCGTIHSGMKWSPQNKTAFGNWFGLYCDHCGKIIPCLRNLTSFIVIAITFPVWFWFKDRWKENWLAGQKEKFSKPLVLTVPHFTWWIEGLQMGWGLYLLTLVYKFIILNEPITWKKLVGNLIGAFIIGLIWGGLMKDVVYNNKRTARKSQESIIN